jgi:hypothetical protein
MLNKTQTWIALVLLLISTIGITAATQVATIEATR